MLMTSLAELSDRIQLMTASIHQTLPRCFAAESNANETFGCSWIEFLPNLPGEE